MFPAYSGGGGRKNPNRSTFPDKKPKREYGSSREEYYTAKKCAEIAKRREEEKKKKMQEQRIAQLQECMAMPEMNNFDDDDDDEFGGVDMVLLSTMSEGKPKALEHKKESVSSEDGEIVSDDNIKREIRSSSTSSDDYRRKSRKDKRKRRRRSTSSSSSDSDDDRRHRRKHSKKRKHEKDKKKKARKRKRSRTRSSSSSTSQSPVRRQSDDKYDFLKPKEVDNPLSFILYARQRDGELLSIHEHVYQRERSKYFPPRMVFVGPQSKCKEILFNKVFVADAGTRQPRRERPLFAVKFNERKTERVFFKHSSNGPLEDIVPLSQTPYNINVFQTDDDRNDILKMALTMHDLRDGLGRDHYLNIDADKVRDFSLRQQVYAEQVNIRPNDVSLWLKYVKLQDEYLTNEKEKLSKSSVSERKLSILQKAISKNVKCVELSLARLEVLQEMSDKSIVFHKWKQLLTIFPDRLELWERYLDLVQFDKLYYTPHLMDQAFDLCVDKLSLMLRAEQNRNRGQDVAYRQNDPPAGCVDFVAQVFDRRLRWMIATGNAHRAVASVQAFLERCILTRDGADPAPLDDPGFVRFWNSGLPRIGDTGALGWLMCMSENGFIPDSARESQRQAITEVFVNKETVSQEYSKLFRSKGSYVERMVYLERSLNELSARPWRIIPSEPVNGQLIYEDDFWRCVDANRLVSHYPDLTNLQLILTGFGAKFVGEKCGSLLEQSHQWEQLDGLLPASHDIPLKCIEWSLEVIRWLCMEEVITDPNGSNMSCFAQSFITTMMKQLSIRSRTERGVTFKALQRDMVESVKGFTEEITQSSNQSQGVIALISNRLYIEILKADWLPEKKRLALSWAPMLKHITSRHGLGNCTPEFIPMALELLLARVHNVEQAANWRPDGIDKETNEEKMDMLWKAKVMEIVQLFWCFTNTDEGPLDISVRPSATQILRLELAWRDLHCLTDQSIQYPEHFINVEEAWMAGKIILDNALWLLDREGTRPDELQSYVAAGSLPLQLSKAVTHSLLLRLRCTGGIGATAKKDVQLALWRAFESHPYEVSFIQMLMTVEKTSILFGHKLKSIYKKANPGKMRVAVRWHPVLAHVISEMNRGVQGFEMKEKSSQDVEYEETLKAQAFLRATNLIREYARDSASGEPMLWRIAMILANHAPAKKRQALRTEVFTEAVSHCAWSRDIYLDCLEMKIMNEQDIRDLMAAGGCRVHTLPDEIKACIELNEQQTTQEETALSSMDVTAKTQEPEDPETVQSKASETAQTSSGRRPVDTQVVFGSQPQHGEQLLAHTLIDQVKQEPLDD